MPLILIHGNRVDEEAQNACLRDQTPSFKSCLTFQVIHIYSTNNVGSIMGIVAITITAYFHIFWLISVCLAFENKLNRMLNIIDTNFAQTPIWYSFESQSHMLFNHNPSNWLLGSQTPGRDEIIGTWLGKSMSNTEYSVCRAGLWAGSIAKH